MWRRVREKKVERNADTIKQWGPFALIDGSHQSGQAKGMGACFTFGFMTACPEPRCSTGSGGPDSTVTVLSVMVRACACPLSEGKSILARSQALSALLQENRGKQATLEGP